MNQDFIKHQNDLIKCITSRGALVLEVVKLILNLLEGNLKNRQSIIKNYSSFTKKISKIEICMKGRILEVANHYNVEVSSKNEELKKLIAKFSKLKSEIQKKFSTLLKSVAQKRKGIDAARLEFAKIEKLKDDFILQRYLVTNRTLMREREAKFQKELLDQTNEVMALDSQILEEFDRILHELDKKEVSSISNWNPLESYNDKALQEYFDTLPVVKQHVTERIAFADKKCSKMQLYSIFGDKVYCFSVKTGTNMEKMSEKYNYRQELQTLAGHPKHNVKYFEGKTPVFTTLVSKVDLYSVAMDGYIKIKIPSSKWYKKTDKITLYFRDYDEMKQFMEAFGLEIPGKLMGNNKTETTHEDLVESSKQFHKIEKVQEKSSKESSAAELENDFLSHETKEGRIRENSQATLKNDTLV